MEGIFTIPEKEYRLITENVTINLPAKLAYVHILAVNTDDSDDKKSQTRNIDLVSLISEMGYSSQEVDTFKKIIKGIVSKAWNQASTSVTDPF